MRLKRDKRIEGFYDYLKFHKITGQEAAELLKKQDWFTESFDQEQRLELLNGFSYSLSPEAISVLAYPQIPARLMKICAAMLKQKFLMQPILLEWIFASTITDSDQSLVLTSYRLNKIYKKLCEYDNESKQTGTELKALIDLILKPCKVQITFSILDTYTYGHEEPILLNTFFHADTFIVPISIRSKKNHKILAECYVELPIEDFYNVQDDGLAEIPWIAQLSLLAKAALNIEAYCSLPKLKEQSIPLQTLIKDLIDSFEGRISLREAEHGSLNDDEIDPYEFLYRLEDRVALAKEIEELGLQDQIQLGIEEPNDDGSLIKVYASACTAFNYLK